MATPARDTRPLLETLPTETLFTDAEFVESIRRSDNLELVTPGEFAELLASIDLSDFDDSEPRWEPSPHGELASRGRPQDDLLAQAKRCSRQAMPVAAAALAGAAVCEALIAFASRRSPKFEIRARGIRRQGARSVRDATMAVSKLDLIPPVLHNDLLKYSKQVSRAMSNQCDRRHDLRADETIVGAIMFFHRLDALAERLTTC